MEKEKFSLTKLNIVLIAIAIFIFFCLVITIIVLSNSFGTPIEEPPKLKITEGRTSTIYSRTTTEYTTTTTTTTTKIIPTDSPYYNIDIDNVLSNELFTKKDITKEEVNVIVREAIDFLYSFFYTYDMSLIDTDAVFKGVKEGENDVATFNNYKYAMIYNSNELLDKISTRSFIASIGNSKINNNSIIKYNFSNRIYYKLEPIGDKFTIEIVAITNSLNSDHIDSEIRYYLSNYKEKGYNTPVYSKLDLSLVYEDGRWKINGFVFPYKGE